MSDYEKLARFYDGVTGNQKQSAALIYKLINEYHPEAQTLMDAACGTGSHLVHLSKHFVTSGLDICPEMLSIAYTKLSGVPLYQSDMTKFNFGKVYDVIICMNDSINHLTKRESWLKLFKNIFNNLESNGVFIFNVNTLYNLNRLSDLPPDIHQFKNNYLITKVRYKKNNLYEWDLRLFEYLLENQYSLHQSILYQISHKKVEIRQLLSSVFKKIYIFDSQQKIASPRCERLYCVAIK